MTLYIRVDTLREGEPIPVVIESASAGNKTWSITGTTSDFESLGGTAIDGGFSASTGFYYSYFLLNPKITLATAPRNFTASADGSSLTLTLNPAAQMNTQGLQVFDAFGNIFLDTNCKSFIELGTFAVDGSPTGSGWFGNEFSPYYIITNAAFEVGMEVFYRIDNGVGNFGVLCTTVTTTGQITIMLAQQSSGVIVRYGIF